VTSRGLREVHFAGLTVYEPQALARLPQGVSEAPRDLWFPLIRCGGPGAVAGHLAEGYFSDVGTWERLFDTHRERLRTSHPAFPESVRIHEPVHVDPTAVLEGPVDLGPAVTLGPRVLVRGPARLSDLIVLPGERLGPGQWHRGVAAAGLFLQPPP
jgi:NDP-sugar pyrophosphorylase family protein